MNSLKLLKTLSAAHGMGGVNEALDAAQTELEKFSDVVRFGNSIIATVKGESDYTVMLDAHIDEIGFMVTNVLDNGFVKVAKAGGIDVRTLPASEVVIHGKRDITGVFATLPPHLKKEDELPELSEMVIDTGYEDVKGIVFVGDRVTFRRSPAQLLNGCLTGKSLDDRSGCAALIIAGQLLAEEKPPVTVKILLSDQEELGCLGAQTAAFSIRPDEAVAVDVSFGDGPDIPADKCGKLFGGPMIGVSPVLSQRITRKLQTIAKTESMTYQLEAMGGRTSTNADVIALSGAGIPSGLVSIPLRNMHTAAEVISAEDTESVAKLLYKYCMGGGAK